MNIKTICSFFLVVVGTICFLSAPCTALEPDEILVVANRNAARSVGLAKYYMKRRGIPKENLIKLWVTDKEQCSRMDYDKKIAAPVKRYIEKNEFNGKESLQLKIRDIKASHAEDWRCLHTTRNNSPTKKHVSIPIFTGFKPAPTSISNLEKFHPVVNPQSGIWSKSTPLETHLAYRSSCLHRNHGGWMRSAPHTRAPFS